MIYLNDKLKITKAILEQIPDHAFTEEYMIPFDKLVFKWWQGGRSSTSLRLTDSGFEAFSKANISYYDFPILSDKLNLADILNNTNRFTLTLNKKIRCPFYISNVPKDSKNLYPQLEFMMIKLLCL
jgi:hypothetical protein